MGLGQYAGSNPGSYEDVYYAGTGTLTVGQLIAFGLDGTNNPTSLPAGSLAIPPTSSVGERNLLGREVDDIISTNNNVIAGVVSDLRVLPGGVGPGWITIQKPVKGDVCDIYCKFSATLNSDIVGSGTGNSNTAISLGTSGTASATARIVGIAMQTVDRSTTAGLVRCRFI